MLSSPIGDTPDCVGQTVLAQVKVLAGNWTIVLVGMVMTTPLIVTVPPAVDPGAAGQFPVTVAL